MDFIKPQRNKLFDIHATNDDLSAMTEATEETYSGTGDIENQQKNSWSPMLFHPAMSPLSTDIHYHPLPIHSDLRFTLK